MLENKVAIVTGGTRGIGYETVKLFAQNGAKVILFGSKEQSVTNAIEKLKKENIIVEGYFPNLNDFEEVEETITKIHQKYGQIDVLINNAGISANKK